MKIKVLKKMNRGNKNPTSTHLPLIQEAVLALKQQPQETNNPSKRNHNSLGKFGKPTSGYDAGTLDLFEGKPSTMYILPLIRPVLKWKSL